MYWADVKKIRSKKGRLMLRNFISSLKFNISPKFDYIGLLVWHISELWRKLPRRPCLRHDFRAQMAKMHYDDKEYILVPVCQKCGKIVTEAYKRGTSFK